MSSAEPPEFPSDSREAGPDLPSHPEEATPPLPPEEHPGPARRPLPLARLILGAILLAGGVLWLLGATDVADVSPLPVLAGALIVVGLALVAGSRTGGHSGLIALGVVLTVVLAGASMFDIRLAGGVGERTFSPTSITDLHKRYDLALGQLTIDLRDLQVGSGTVIVEARVGVGELVVHVPASAVEAHGRAGLGQVTLLGRADSGFDVDVTVRSPNPTGTGSILALELSVGIGQVTVDGG
jgi:hypothetical protein